MKWKIEAFSIVIFSMYIINILSKIEVLEIGIPFCKNKRFSKLSPCYVTNLEFLLQTICYNS